MRKLKDVLRLKYESGLSNRQIGKSLSISPGTVSTYLSSARCAGVSWPLPKEMSDDDLESQIFPPLAESRDSKTEEADFGAIHLELKRKGVTLQLVWEEYKAGCAGKPMSYPHFCRRYRAWRKCLDVSMRQIHKAGEKLFIDYAGQTMPIVDRTTGEVHHAHIFVACLGASNYTYAEVTASQELPNWIASHVRAFEFFGGVPELVVPDNLKSAVTKACRYEPDLNPTYHDLIAHYGTAVMPARPAKPQDKAKVETAVQIVERWILAKLRHQTFFSLGELNKAIHALLSEMNDKPFQKLPGSRRSQFESLDKKALKPLPNTPYEFARFKKARVNIDYHIELEGHYYSVPYALNRQVIEAKITAHQVAIYHKGKRVALHLRAQRKGAFTTCKEHMPKSHRLHSDWSPGRLLNWAQTIGPSTIEMVKNLLDKPHVEQGYRASLGLLNLNKRFGSTRLEAACKRAIAIGSPTRRSVLSILEKGLDKQPVNTDCTTELPSHSNIRGSKYYH